MAELETFINQLINPTPEQQEIHKAIPCIPSLLNRLQGFQRTVIGNDKLKNAVARQINGIIFSKYREKKLGVRENKSMLNTCLYGPPGVGKTSIALHLSYIWQCLDCLEQAPIKRSVDASMLNKFGISSNAPSQKEGGWGWYAFLVVMAFVAVGFVIGIISQAYSNYKKLGKTAFVTLLIIGIVIFFIILFALYYLLRDESTEHKAISKDGTVQLIDPSPLSIFHRDDFVGQYVGQTDKKTRDILNNNPGKVIFIDEVYSFVPDGGGRDYGIDALNLINTHMSEFPRRNIFIFAGYKDEMERTVFTAQPGLKSRFPFLFEITPYSSEELFEIFCRHAAKNGYRIGDEEQVKNLFNIERELFSAQGRDCERLFSYACQHHSIDFVADPVNINLEILGYPQIRAAIEDLRANQVKVNKPSTNIDILRGLDKYFNKPSGNDRKPPDSGSSYSDSGSSYSDSSSDDSNTSSCSTSSCSLVKRKDLDPYL